MATIQGIYLALFGRPADPGGLAYWNGVTNDGADLSAMIGALTASEEFIARFGPDASAATVISTIYRALFNREPDADGLAFFLGELASGAQTIESIAINIIDGARNEDLTVVSNKELAANSFTASLDTPEKIAGYVGANAIQHAQNLLQQVTADPGSIPTAATIAQTVDDIVQQVPAPQPQEPQPQEPDPPGDNDGGAGGGGGNTQAPVALDVSFGEIGRGVDIFASATDLVGSFATDADSDLSAASLNFLTATVGGVAFDLADIGFSFTAAGSGDAGSFTIDTQGIAAFATLADGQSITVEVTFEVSDGTFTDTGTLTYTVVGGALDYDVALDVRGPAGASQTITASADIGAGQIAMGVAIGGSLSLTGAFGVLDFTEVAADSYTALVDIDGLNLAIAIAEDDATATASASNHSTAVATASTASTAEASAEGASKAIARAAETSTGEATATNASTAIASATNVSQAVAAAVAASEATATASDRSIASAQASDNSESTATASVDSTAETVAIDNSDSTATAQNDADAFAGSAGSSSSSATAEGGEAGHSDASAISFDNSSSSANAGADSDATALATEESTATAVSNETGSASASANDNSDASAIGTNDSTANASADANSSTTASANLNSIANATASDNSVAGSNADDGSTGTAQALDSSVASASGTNTSSASALANGSSAAAASADADSFATADADNGSASEATATNFGTADAEATLSSVASATADENSTALSSATDSSSTTAFAADGSDAEATASNSSLSTAIAYLQAIAKAIAAGSSDALAVAQQGSTAEATADVESSASSAAGNGADAKSTANTNSTAVSMAAHGNPEVIEFTAISDASLSSVALALSLDGALASAIAENESAARAASDDGEINVNVSNSAARSSETTGGAVWEFIGGDGYDLDLLITEIAGHATVAKAVLADVAMNPIGGISGPGGEVDLAPVDYRPVVERFLTNPDQQLITVTINDPVEVAEGQILTFTLTRDDSDLSQSIVAFLRLGEARPAGNNSAPGAGSDYTGPRDVAFAAGATSADAIFQTLDDATEEGLENLILYAHMIDGNLIGVGFGSIATGFIIDIA